MIHSLINELQYVHPASDVNLKKPAVLFIQVFSQNHWCGRVPFLMNQ